MNESTLVEINEQINYTMYTGNKWSFMMKWIMLMCVGLLTAGCCCNNVGVVTYRQVAVVPVVSFRQVAVAPVIEPVIYSYSEPLDVTTTTIDFY